MDEKSINEIISEMKEMEFKRYNFENLKNIQSLDRHLKNNLCRYGIVETMFLSFYIYGSIDYPIEHLKRVVHKFRYEVLFIKAISSLTYKDFLKTKYWKVVKELAIEKAAKRCELCFSEKSLNVHHKTYQNHYKEHEHYKTDLIVLCQDCHSKFHNKLKD